MAKAALDGLDYLLATHPGTQRVPGTPVLPPPPKGGGGDWPPRGPDPPPLRRGGDWLAPKGGQPGAPPPTGGGERGSSYPEGETRTRIQTHRKRLMDEPA